MGNEPLFRRGDFKLHSGDMSRFKIDCDALTDEDITCLAEMIGTGFSFSRVIGIPRGGLRLAEALLPYCDDGDGFGTLIVDDVLTTGRSMREAYIPGAFGVVIFARGWCDPWITPIFQMYGRLHKADRPSNPNPTVEEGRS